MRKAAAILVLVLITSAAAFADNVQNPQLASSASITDNEDGTITIIGGQMKSMELNISVPLTDSYQSAQYPQTPLYDDEGNPYLRVSEQSPANPYSYAKAVGVQTSARATSSLPASYIVPQEYGDYYLPTSRTQSGDPQIKALAERITENATDPFEKVALIAIWVNSHMTYDASLVGQENDAAWTLSNLRGVCVEYSTLFAALARSINIPTRYVTGYAYSEKFGTWLGHAWDEAYIGDWIPVDATWFEVGSLDAVHIEAGKFMELQKSFALTAYVTPPDAQIKWDNAGRSGAFADNIQTQSVQYSQPWSDYEIRAVEPNLAPGSSTLVYLKIKGTDYRVVQVNLTTCTGQQSATVSNPGQYLILRPNQTTVAVWEVHSAGNLPANYFYTCPMILNSPLLSNKVVSITIDPRVSSLPDYGAQLETATPHAGEQDGVILNLPAGRQGKEYFVMTSGGVYSKAIYSPADEIRFAVPVAKGTAHAYVAGQGGGYYILDFTEGGNNSISIDNFTIQDSLTEGENATAAFSVSAQGYPANLELDFSFGKQEKTVTGSINQPTSYVISFVPQQSGSVQATLVAKSGAAQDEKSMIVQVAPAPPKGQQPTSAPLEGSTPNGSQKNLPPSPAPQPQNSCPLPLAILFISLAIVAIKR